MQSFALLSLPLLALDQILRSMDIQNLLDLATISLVIKKYLPLLRIPFGGYRVHLGNNSFKVSVPEYTLYHLQSFGEARALVDDLKDLFTGNVNYLNVCHSHLRNPIKETTDVLAIGNPKNEYFWIEQYHYVAEEDLNAFLDNVDFKRGLIMDGPQEMPTGHKKVLSVDWLKISNTKWITMEILKKMKNKVIFLEDVVFTAEQITEFIRDMRNGNGKQNLQAITFTSRSQGEEFFNVVDDLDLVPIQGQQIYKFSEEDSKMDISKFLLVGSSEGIPFRNSFEFTRVDGVRCRVVFYTGAASNYLWNQGK